MDIEKIEVILTSSSSAILAAGSFSERIDVVYDILDKAFPRTSAVAAVYGPITSLTDFMSRTEIEPLLQVIEKSSKSGHEFVTSDTELNNILKAIYEMVQK